MFKKKSAPSLQHRNGDLTPAPGRDGNRPHASGPSSARKATEWQDFDFGIPTLNATPASASSSASNAQRNSRHGRSASHPFPALLGSIGIKRDGNKTDRGAAAAQSTNKPSASGQGLLSSSLPKSNPKAQAQPATDGDLITGKCATCDSPVAWPRHLDVFRCSVCHMVNDLQYGADSWMLTWAKDTD